MPVFWLIFPYFGYISYRSIPEGIKRIMSINAINSVSIYEYYYSINQKEKKKESPLADEMRKYGLVPTDNEVINAAMLRQAKQIQEQNNTQEQEVANSDRPWADLMYQLNLPFNDDPKDDIEDIKEELASLMRGVDDEELLKEVDDLEKSVEDMYIRFQKNYQESAFSTTLTSQLNNFSLLNIANLL